MKVTGRLVAAARALAGVSRQEFAIAAGVSVSELARIETKGSARLSTESEAAAVLRAFERFGVVALGEEGGMGAGVRLKFTRQDVKQIIRLEGEGGIVAPDDNP
jgi:transcriptional regulator with XRE-family HTH domain